MLKLVLQSCQVFQLSCELLMVAETFVITGCLCFSLKVVYCFCFIVTDKADSEYLQGMVTLATSNKDEVRFLQELGFQLVDISQPATSTSGNEKEVKMTEPGGLSLTLVIPGVSESLHVVVSGL